MYYLLILLAFQGIISLHEWRQKGRTRKASALTRTRIYRSQYGTQVLTHGEGYTDQQWQAIMAQLDKEEA